MPKDSISVLLPFRNAGATLEASLQGILACADPALEVLAVDDGSSDGGPHLVRSWAQREPRLRLLHTGGVGLVAALNFGLAQARGGLVARMDGDDLCHPERLERQRAALLARPELALVGCRVEAFAEAGAVGEGLRLYVAWQNQLLTPEDHRRELFIESPLCHPSIMVRRDALASVGDYQETGGPEDYELLLRLDRAGYALAKLPETLLSWRHGAGRATFSDPRYSLPRMREAKAPFLAQRLASIVKPRKVLWGAGPTGKRLARALARHGFHVDCFVDVDPRKLRAHSAGRTIMPPDGLDPRTDLVVAAVGARGGRALIRADLTARGFVEGLDAYFAA